MKIILNECYGGFSIAKEWADLLGVYPHDEEKLRFNEVLIKAIEAGLQVSDFHSELRVITIPDNATDYKITEYDGCESLIYVVDGKLHWA